MSTREQTLLEIYHPTFRQGYQHGREQHFGDPRPLTDLHFVEHMRDIVLEESQQEGGQEQDQEEAVYYTIGRLVGQMSGGAIPRQPHEDHTLELQETFLAKVMQAYGAEGQALSDTIRRFWAMQDQLAQTLDADTFKLMIYRGVEHHEAE